MLVRLMAATIRCQPTDAGFVLIVLNGVGFTCEILELRRLVDTGQSCPWNQISCSSPTVLQLRDIDQGKPGVTALEPNDEPCTRAHNTSSRRVALQRDR